MRDPLGQAALSILARSPFIHLIASIDHINALIMWDPEMLNRFGFLYIEANTYRCYRSELLSGYSKLLRLCPTSAADSEHTQASLDAFWQSLSNNSRKILWILSKLTTSSKPSVTFEDLFKKARDNFAVSTVETLSQHLVEFNEHHVTKEDKNREGHRTVVLLVSCLLLKEFLAEQSQIESWNELEM